MRAPRNIHVYLKKLRRNMVPTAKSAVENAHFGKMRVWNVKTTGELERTFAL
jgi:hypothetical protein